MSKFTLAIRQSGVAAPGAKRAFSPGAPGGDTVAGPGALAPGSIAKEQPMTERQPLATAEDLAALGSQPWPNESAAYRQARQKLLAEEIALRRQIQRVAAQRRALPPGPVAQDYRFLDAQGNELRLLDLFGEHDTLFTYFWMYGPERERPCPMCTSFVGSLDIPAPDIEQRIALAIVGRSPVARQLAFARERGWTHLRFYQTVGDAFAIDYRGLSHGDEGAM
ncbi:MAG: DUF899 family protein, partial [Thermomicrobiales bacterium]|nr:DUF899 family protein [Thermomicrobiales bacterium]